MTFISTDVSKNLSFWNANERLLATEGDTIRLGLVNNPMNCLKVLPDKLSDSRILRHHFVRTIRKFVLSSGTLDRNIIHKGLGPMRDLRMEDMSDITLKNGRGVRPTHRKYSQAESTKWSVEGCQVMRVRIKLMLVEGDV